MPDQPDELTERFAALAARVDRTASRLRRTPLNRISVTAAAGTLAAVQELADLAAGLAATGSVEPPVPPPARVPELGAHVLGDQLAVVGRELLGAALAGPEAARSRALAAAEATLERITDLVWAELRPS